MIAQGPKLKAQRKKPWAVLLAGVVLLLAGAAQAAPRLVWDASTGVVDGYRVYRAENSGGPYANPITVGGDVLGVDLGPLGLDREKTWVFICKAFNVGGESGPSNEAVLWCLLAGDANRDGRVDILDKLIVRDHFGDAGPLGDVNEDGIVDILDKAIVRDHYGEVCP